MSERILVTGAGGFLGSHIANHMGTAGHAIAAVGRFVASPEYVQTVPHLWNLCGMTLPDPAFPAIVSAFKPTTLIHCAGTASVPDSVRAPFEDFRRTVDVCAFTLETMRIQSPNCRFILLSSASVYGNPPRLPILENSPLQPVSPYGYHKLLCETLTTEYSALFGIKAVILRIFSAYGIRLKRQVVYEIFRKFIDPDFAAVELSGAGTESRDFINARDVARAVEILIHTDASGIYNCASGTQTTIEQLAHLIARELNSSKPISFNGQGRAGDPLYWQADVSALAALGFAPQISIGDGITELRKWLMKEGQK